MTDHRVRDDFITPLSWLVAAASGNGAAGRPFPTITEAEPAKAKELPHVPPPLAQLPHAEKADVGLPREESCAGPNGGEEEC